MDIGPEYLKLIIAAASITYSVIFGIVAKKVWDVPALVDNRLKDHEEVLAVRMDKMDNESKLAHRRINVHDRLSSRHYGRDFDSRAIAETGIFPEVKA